MVVPDRDKRLSRCAAPHAASGHAAAAGASRRPSRGTSAARGPAVVAALSGPAAGAGRSRGARARRGRRRAGDDGDRVPRRDPALAAEAAGGAGPAQCARMVSERHGGAARGERRRREQRASEGPGHAAGAPAQAADRLGAVLRADRRGAGAASALRGRPRARRRRGAGRVAPRGCAAHMPPHPTWYLGRDAIAVASEKGFHPEFGRLQSIIAGANLQPAAAHYLRRPGETEYRPLALDVLRVDGGLIAEIHSFAMTLSPIFVVEGERPSRIKEIQ